MRPFSSILFFISIIVANILLYTLFETNRGQGMSMPFIQTLAVMAILLPTLIVYFVVCSRVRNKVILYIGLLIELISICIYINKGYFFYRWEYHWSKDEFEAWDGLYPPSSENFWVVGICTSIIVAWLVYRIAKLKKLNLASQQE